MQTAPLKKLFLILLLLTIFAGQKNLFAVTFENAITVRDASFTSFMNAAKSRSWDGPNTVPFGSVGPNNPIAAFVNTNEYLQYGSFNGSFDLNGSFLWEVTDYVDLNTFGVVNLTTNTFTPLVHALDAPGYQFAENFNTSNLYTFAFQTPKGLFHAQDSLDPTFPHIVGQRAIKDGTLTLNGKNFDVLTGDYFFYMEDLTNGFSDQDYNDNISLLRVRQPSRTGEISPEPATLFLFLMGLAALLGFKKISA